MALINKLEAIGDAIRSKTGGTEELTLDEMATAINGLEVGASGGSALLTARITQSSSNTFDLSNYVSPESHFLFFYTFKTSSGGGVYTKAIYRCKGKNNYTENVATLNSNTASSSGGAVVNQGIMGFAAGGSATVSTINTYITLVNSSPSTEWNNCTLTLNNGASFGTNGLLMYVG